MSSTKQGIPKKQFTMGVFAMAMLTVAAVLSLRNLPNMAAYGWAIIFYLTMACICFFIPSALVSAELASTFPENGGVYVWVREAFGPKWGFVAIFMEWVENLPWFPACLTFVASALAYVIDPSLATNRWFVFFTILFFLWLSTFLNFRGMRLSAWLSNSGVLAGTIIPGIGIIIMVIVYLIEGKPVQISFDHGAALLPNLSDPSQWMLLAGMMVALSGMEMSSVHVLDMKNPRTSFPRAIFLAAFIVIVLSILGSLAIALVVNPNKLSLAAGVPQAFAEIFDALNLSWCTPIMCFLLAYGAVTMVVTWILGPSKGMLAVAQQGYLPKFWQYRNSYGMPTHILWVQAILSSILACNVLFVPTMSNAFWIMSALTAQLYMVMYLLMFAAAIKLRYSKPNVYRPYKVPGGKFGMWCIAGVAFLTSLLSMIVGFIPPSNIIADGTGPILWYVGFLLVGTVFFVCLPLYFFGWYRRKLEKQGLHIDAQGNVLDDKGNVRIATTRTPTPAQLSDEAVQHEATHAAIASATGTVLAGTAVLAEHTPTISSVHSKVNELIQSVIEEQKEASMTVKNAAAITQNAAQTASLASQAAASAAKTAAIAQKAAEDAAKVAQEASDLASKTFSKVKQVMVALPEEEEKEDKLIEAQVEAGIEKIPAASKADMAKPLSAVSAPAVSAPAVSASPVSEASQKAPASEPKMSVENVTPIPVQHESSVPASALKGKDSAKE